MEIYIFINYYSVCTILHHGLESDHPRYWQGCGNMRTLMLYTTDGSKISAVTSETTLHYLVSCRCTYSGGLWVEGSPPTMACGPTQPATCFCTACKPRKLFTFLVGWDKPEVYFMICESYSKFTYRRSKRKLYGDTTMLIHVHMVCDCFCDITAELGICHRNYRALRAYI